MDREENKITVIKPKKGFEHMKPAFNCHMTLSKKSAILFFPKMAMIAPLEMSKSIIEEGPTHIEFKINLNDELFDIMIKTIHNHNFKICLNNN